MQLTAQEIATMLDGKLEGDPLVVVSRPGKIEEGGAGSISFLGHPKYEAYVYQTSASVVVVSQDFIPRQSVSATLIRVPDVRASFSRLLRYFESMSLGKPRGIAPEAFIHPSAQVAATAAVGRFTTIEANVRLGENSVIFDQVYIGPNVHIGDDTMIFPGARILHDCVIGDRCVIHANTVIGSDGFGFAPDATGQYQKVPQVGRVIIEDDVEIGANTTIDRATLEATIIRRGVKLDNLIQVGHNVEIGPDTVVAAQTGIAGSTKIGARCRIGGQVGIVGHIEIADGTQIQAQSGVAGSQEERDMALFGTPAFEYYSYLRSYAVFKELPALNRRLRQLEKMLANGRPGPSAEPE